MNTKHENIGACGKDRSKYGTGAAGTVKAGNPHTKGSGPKKG